mgnify:CR=1 FL=1
MRVCGSLTAQTSDQRLFQSQLDISWSTVCLKNWSVPRL